MGRGVEAESVLEYMWNQVPVKRRNVLKALGIGLGGALLLGELTSAVDSIPTTEEEARKLYQSLQMSGTQIDIFPGTVTIKPTVASAASPKIGLGLRQPNPEEKPIRIYKPVVHKAFYPGVHGDQQSEDYLVGLKGNGLVFYPFSQEAQSFMQFQGDPTRTRVEVRSFTPGYRTRGKTTPEVICGLPNDLRSFPVGYVLPS